VRAHIRSRIPHLDEDRFLAPDLAVAAAMVRDGSLAAAAGRPLPSLAGDAP
jgi:histidine ammonia-lyase